MQHIQIPDGEPQSELVSAAADAIRAGKLVVLPTETVYGLAVDPDNGAAIERLKHLKMRPEGQHFTHHLHDITQLAELAEEPPSRVRRFLDRFWPGPLTIVLPARRDASGAEAVDHSIGLRVPAHDFTRAVIQAVGRSLFMTSVNKSGGEPLADPTDIARELPGIDMLFDAGKPRLGTPSSVVKFDRGFSEVLREGLLSSAELLVGMAAKILFVCTGNTCRSPMAEALARRLLAEELGLQENELPYRGLFFGSVGIATMHGMPASSGAREAMSERGIELGRHRSQVLNPTLVQDADRIYGLATSHCHAVLAMAPGAGSKTVLLRPDGEDIRDPFGADVSVYRETAKEIEAAILERKPEILALLD